MGSATEPQNGQKCAVPVEMEEMVTDLLRKLQTVLEPWKP